MFKKRTRPASIRSKDTPPSLPAPSDDPSTSGTSSLDVITASSSNLPTSASSSSSSSDPLVKGQDVPSTQPQGDSSLVPSTVAPDNNGDDDDEPSVGATIQDLLSLRRLRKQAEGLDLEKLNRGEVRRRKKKAVVAAAAEDGGEDEEEDDGLEYTADGNQVGLRAGKGKEREEIEGDDASARMKRLMKASNFTQQTNALDVDKHMMAYIEAELAKRRGGNGPADAAAAAASEQQANQAAFVDPQEELYAIAEQYRNEQREKAKGEDDDGGNVMNSMAMLTAIPEVDLGMDNRLKNIEDTEKAKRLMLEARKKQQIPTEAENDFAAARFYRPHARIQSDHHALQEAKRAAQGLPPTNPKRHQHGGPGGRKPEMATDDLVMERFKKRMRK